MTGDIEDTDDWEWDGVTPAPHMDTCECEECCPQPVRPMPPEADEFPDVEALLDRREALALLRELNREFELFGPPPSVWVPRKWGDRYSVTELEHWVSESKWYAARFGGVDVG